MNEQSITELTDLIRAHLDAEQQLAEKVAARFVYPSDETTSPDLRGKPFWPWPSSGTTRQVAPEVRATRELVRAFSPQRVLTEVAAKRQLLDQALAWRHDVHDDSWYTCSAATDEDDGETYAEMDGGGPCTCGRDVRVLQVLELLARPYQETT